MSQVTIYQDMIGKQQVYAVDGKELHDFLEVTSKDYNAWINKGLKVVGAKAGEDYKKIKLPNENGRMVTVYSVHISTAKHIVMINRVPKADLLKQELAQAEIDIFKKKTSEAEELLANNKKENIVVRLLHENQKLKEKIRVAYEKAHNSNKARALS